jgi:ABC-type branched-subunit amino acid transport system ATPase component/ABC-type branched-subunit amino acid transport system permease subunit
VTLSTDSLILGLTTGLTYALLATGLVLIYKSSRFVNFAHGQLGAFSAMLVAKLVNDHGVNYWVAFALALAVAVFVAGAVELTVIRRLFNAPRVVLMVASIGVAQLLYAASFFGAFRPNATRLVRQGYPTPFNVTVRLLGFTLHGREFMILFFAPVAAIAIAYLLRATHTGVRIQAVASNDEAARLAGIPVRRVSTTVWVVAGLLAALTAILLGPGRGTVNTEVLGPALLARALIAALFGRMTNLPAAFGAGIAVGVVEQVSLANVGGGTTELLLYATMLAVLLWRASGVARQHRGAEEAKPFAARPRPVPADIARPDLLSALRAGGAALALVAAVLAPFAPGLDTQGQALLLSQTCIFAILGISLFVLVNWCGQLSLGHFALLGVGAFTAARLSGAGYSLPFVLIVGGAVGAVTAIVIGLPAARVSGLFLGVSTLGFAVVAPGWLFRQAWLTSGHSSVAPARLPFIGTVTSPRGLYYVTLGVLLITLVAVAVMRRTIARRLIAVRDNPRGASAHGLPPVGVNVTGFAISGFIAAAAGVLWGYVNVHFDATAFNPSQSLALLAMVVVGGLSSSLGAVIGAVVVIGVPTLLHLSPTFIFATSGAGLVSVLMQMPGGLLTPGYALRDALLRGLNTLSSRATITVAEERADGAPALDCRDLRVTFGGLVALDGVSLRVEQGEIVGLIGANGAGKTTLMDCVSGYVRPADGVILTHGRDVSDLGPEYRAYASVARTFQDARLYPGLTVRETMLVAQEPTERPTFFSALFRAPWQRDSERRAATAADEALRFCGIERYADVHVADLPTGVRRTCALATVLLQRPKLLLLDEPTAGLPHTEVLAFAPLIRRMRDELDCAVLLIEHDMGLVMALCDRLYALEAGRNIADGAPQDVANSPAVIGSYLGANAATIERSRTAPSTNGKRARRPRPTRPVPSRSANGN